MISMINVLRLEEFGQKDVIEESRKELFYRY